MSDPIWYPEDYGGPEPWLRYCIITVGAILWAAFFWWTAS